LSITEINQKQLLRLGYIIIPDGLVQGHIPAGNAASGQHQTKDDNNAEAFPAAGQTFGIVVSCTNVRFTKQEFLLR
jgi:hypothetical protein